MSHPLILTNDEIILFTDAGNSEKVQHVWDAFPGIRAEFGTFEVFQHYVWALSHDQVHTCTVAGVRSMAKPKTLMTTLG